MKISMILVAVSTVLARSIMNSPYSIIDYVIETVSTLTGGPWLNDTKVLLSLTQIQNNASSSSSSSSISSREQALDTALSQSDELTIKARNEMYDLVNNKIQNRGEPETRYCRQYYSQIFRNGDLNKDLGLDYNEYIGIVNYWNMEVDVADIKFGFKVMDVDKNQLVDQNEWTSLISEILPVSMGLTTSGGPMTLQC